MKLPRPVAIDFPISSGFGTFRELTIHGKVTKRYHWGYDFACPKNTIVRAVADGPVYKSGWQVPKKPGVNDDSSLPDYFAKRGFGLRVWQKAHLEGKDIWIFYAHLNDVWAHTGRFLQAGNIIGLSGNTGRSSGPHLHIEFRIAGTLKRIPANFYEPQLTDDFYRKPP